MSLFTKILLLYFETLNKEMLVGWWLETLNSALVDTIERKKRVRKIFKILLVRYLNNFGNTFCKNSNRIHILNTIHPTTRILAIWIFLKAFYPIPMNVAFRLFDVLIIAVTVQSLFSILIFALIRHRIFRKYLLVMYLTISIMIFWTYPLLNLAIHGLFIVNIYVKSV